MASPEKRHVAVHVTGTEPQQKFWNATERFRAFVGGVGSGKTYAGCIEVLRQPANSRGVVLAPTYPMLRDATLDTFHQLMRDTNMLKPGAAGWSKSEMKATMRNNTEVLFRSADDPEKLRGPNLGWFWPDEGAMMPELVWDIMIGRLRLSPGRGWVTTTPKGMNWLHKVFVKDNRAGYRLIQCSTESNTFLKRFFIETLKEKYTGAWLEQEFSGQFVDWVNAPAYERFQRARNVMPNQMEHYRSRMPLKVGIDYNARCMVWPVIQVNGRQPRVLCEIAQVGRTSIREMTRLLRLQFPDHTGGIELYPDATGQGLSAQTGMESHDVVIEGLRGFPSEVTLCAPRINPKVRNRVNSVNSLLDGTGEWLPLIIDDSCEMLIRDLVFTEWNESGTDLKKISDLNDDRSTLTHATDALGYWACIDAPIASVYLSKEEDEAAAPRWNPYQAAMGPREILSRIRENRASEFTSSWDDDVF